MKADILVAEIGSTTTVVNAFDAIDSDKPIFLGQGQAPTSVGMGDVTIGLFRSIDNLKENMKTDTLEWNEFFASSSAAGGLKMTVHGLVYDMTVRAAKEAALGAGAIIKYITAGKLRKSDLNKIKEIDPNLILVAGGVDYGERDTALYNMELILNMRLKTPIIYAGNIENRQEIMDITKDANQKIYMVDNVYPRIDDLNITPARQAIQQAFEEHITRAPGMAKIKELVNGPIIPTPGAVMEASMSLYEDIGDLLVVDVGGATTDVHSVTEGSDEIQKILISPEPAAKRTVEGDLGVYINLHNIIEYLEYDKLLEEFGKDIEKFIRDPKPIPETNMEKSFIEKITHEAVSIALRRHAGKLRSFYGPSGKKTIAEGKDLTNVKWVIGTGGALTRLSGRELLKKALSANTGSLYPKGNFSIFIDNHYIMASLGVLSKKYKRAAVSLLKESLSL
ncbi:GlmL-related ornithine degradation protein [Oxobacter pfennigii]|nr:GlmL-related ornithine degradation protein [Oxobacter pfennigii]